MSLSFSSRDRGLAREVGQRRSPVALRLYHLRREIIRGANHRLGRLERVRQHATDAKVSELRHAILGQQHVGGLDVAMQQLFGVDMLEACKDMPHSFHHLALGQRLA